MRPGRAQGLEPADPDWQINHVLTGIGKVRPSAGLEDRLGAALRMRPSNRQGWSPWPGGSWVLAGCCVVLMVVLGGGARWVRSWPARRSVPQTKVARTERADPGAVAGRSEQAFPGVAVAALKHQIRGAALARKSGERVQAGLEADAGRASQGFAEPSEAPPAQEALDRAAMDDTYTASFPAPPLPPTAQERQVRLMLRRGEKHDLAQLDPVQGVIAAGQDRAQLRSFFEPPRPEVDPFQGVLPW